MCKKRGTMKHVILGAALCFCALPADAQEHAAAKNLFKDITSPMRTAPESFGGYANGCLAGGVKLFEDGPHWAAMRLSRQRNWGHPELADFIARLSAGAARIGYHGLLIGDMGRARGGPMISGHRSHQSGLDVDIWMRPMTERPNKNQRESWSSYDVVKGRSALDKALWQKSAWRAIELAAQDTAVARIFVNPAIKRELCKTTSDAPWLNKVRPWWGHDAHFHVRLSCPAHDKECVEQAPPPAGSGCGDELAWWFTDEPYKPSDKPPPKDLTMNDLPKACGWVLGAK